MYVCYLKCIYLYSLNLRDFRRDAAQHMATSDAALQYLPFRLVQAHISTVCNRERGALIEVSVQLHTFLHPARSPISACRCACRHTFASLRGLGFRRFGEPQQPHEGACTMPDPNRRARCFFRKDLDADGRQMH